MSNAHPYHINVCWQMGKNLKKKTYILKADRRPEKNWIFRKMAQKWPKMTQSGPNMTQNGPRITQNDPTWPNVDPHFFRNIFWPLPSSRSSGWQGWRRGRRLHCNLLLPLPWRQPWYHVHLQSSWCNVGQPRSPVVLVFDHNQNQWDDHVHHHDHHYHHR